MDAEAWKKMIETNPQQPFQCDTALFAPMYEKAIAESLIFLQSMAQKVSLDKTNYSAAKAGMIGFSKALAAEGG